MKREIKNNGEYVELDADCVFAKADLVQKAEILVLTKGRFELAGNEKTKFVEKFSRMRSACEVSQDFNKMSDEQKSDFVFRKMMVE